MVLAHPDRALSLCFFVSLIFCFFVSDKNFQWQLENIFSKLSQPLVRGWPSSKAPLGKYPQPLRS